MDIKIRLDFLVRLELGEDYLYSIFSWIFLVKYLLFFLLQLLLV